MNSGKQIFDLYNRCHLPSAETFFVLSQLYSDCMNREEEMHMGDYTPAFNDSLNDFPPGSLEHRLSVFNAKERFALIQRVTGMSIAPSPAFLAETLQSCGIEANAGRVFCAMDYHLDWLYAALMKDQLDPEPMPLVADEYGSFPVTGRQQDADFVMCFTAKNADGNPVTHLLLIEAKGVGAWDSDQVAEKLKQYRAMRPAFARNPHVCPRLVLMSPDDPRRKESRQSTRFRGLLADFKDFGEVAWVKMPMPETHMVNRLRDEGRKDGPFTRWKVSNRSRANASTEQD